MIEKKAINTAEGVQLDAKDIDDFRDLITQAGHICLLGHIGPDGDAIGATTAFAACLRAAYPGLKVDVVLPNELPRILFYTPGADEVLIHANRPQEAEEAIKSADLICCMDFQDAHRVGEKLSPTLRAAEAPKVLIDHHLYPSKDFFALCFSYPPLSSTCELTYRLIVALGLSEHIDADIATSLLTGIITDTGCFAFSSEYPTIFRIAADLIEYGARKVEIINANFHSMRIDQFRLRGYALGEKLQILPEIHTAYFILTDEDLAHYKSVGNDTEGFVNTPLDMDGIHYSIFVREQGGQIKISLRSIGDYAVNDLAYDLFGGGGHKNAAGAECGLDQGLEATALKIVEAIRQRQA